VVSVEFFNGRHSQAPLERCAVCEGRVASVMS
jgi:hypothetical protein